MKKRKRISDIITIIVLVILMVLLIRHKRMTINEALNIVKADTVDIVLYATYDKVIIVDRPVNEIPNKELVSALEVLEIQGGYEVGTRKE